MVSSKNLLRVGAPLMALVLALGAFMWTQKSVAQGAASEAEIANVEQLLKTKFPNAKIANIRRARTPGMFEASLETDLVYVDPANKQLFVGALYDMTTMDNYTETRQNELFGFRWDDLPFDKSIKMVRGKGTRRVAVFTDADCPFCKRLEQTFQQMDDVTVYNFLMPIDSLHPDAGRKSKIIWCSKDRVKSWMDFMLNGKLVDGKGDCVNPVDELKALGQAKRVNGTPHMVLPDNRSLAGALPKAQLEEQLNRAEATAKTKKS